MNEVWDGYRTAWSRAPWLVAVLILGVLLFVLGVVGTILRDPVAFLFIPGLAVLYVHHLFAQRRAQ